LWQGWKAARAERGTALDDENARLEWAMELAESLDAPLATLWAAMQRWLALEALLRHPKQDSTVPDVMFDAILDESIVHAIACGTFISKTACF
jgi:hypothetical protein